MGFIRTQTKTKKDKTYQYFYYSERRRSRVKDGGTGKVKSIDYLLGSSALGSYLAFWLWDGLSLSQFAEAVVEYEFKTWKFSLREINWQIDWKLTKGKTVAGKVTLRSAKGGDNDARGKFPRWIKQRLQDRIDWIIQVQDSIANDIRAIAYYLAKYERKKQDKARIQDDYEKWVKDPDRVWWKGNVKWSYAPDYGDNCLQNLEVIQANQDYYFESYQTKIAKLLELCPPSERERFKAGIIRQSEKLASSSNYIDRYEIE